MKTLILVALVSALAVTALISIAGDVALAQTSPAGATADVRDATGRAIGHAEFREGQGEVIITMSFATPLALSGSHGMRIHEIGRCDPPAFLSAGGGFNPLGKPHGRQNPSGSQVGDLPNVNFTNGLTSYNTAATGATLGAGPTSLLGPNQTALIIYANEDDQITDPDGKAGARIACGVITAASNVPGAQLLPSGNLSGGPAVIIAVIGVAFIGAGYAMRRASGARKPS